MNFPLISNLTKEYYNFIPIEEKKIIEAIQEMLSFSCMYIYKAKYDI